MHLLRRKNLKGGGNLLLPAHLVLAEDLGTDWEALAALGQKTCADDDCIVPHDLLMVIRVRGAVGAVVAVDALAWTDVSWSEVPRNLEGGRGAFGTRRKEIDDQGGKMKGITTGESLPESPL